MRVTDAYAGAYALTQTRVCSHVATHGMALCSLAAKQRSTGTGKGTYSIIGTARQHNCNTNNFGNYSHISDIDGNDDAQFLPCSDTHMGGAYLGYM